MMPPAMPGPGAPGTSAAVADGQAATDVLTRQGTLIERLAGQLRAAGAEVTPFETHISWVLVAGAHAWKIKKAVRLPYLDFSTLAARRFYCMEELRLNRRLAPGLYVDVVPVTGTSGRPVLGGQGEALEYAVWMRAFDQQAVWDVRIANGLLGGEEVDMLAAWLARFHHDAPRAPLAAEWGAPHAVAAAFEATLGELGQLMDGQDRQGDLPALRQWREGQQAVLASRCAYRKTTGMIRECHGDLHCGNILTSNGQVQVFDCIEFSESLRWIDVMDDIAFVHMDLALHGRPDLAASLLSRYLEISGDYAGLAVLRNYRVHRALVRAKVMLLRANQSSVPETIAAARRDGLRYLAFARGCTGAGPAAILITHGCSGSGKTYFSRLLVKELGAVQVRSDVERKRLHGTGEGGEASMQPGEPLYGEAATRRTYARLLSLAREIVAAGWPVVVDATFLAVAERTRFRALAAKLGVPFFIVDLRARRTTMVERLRSRNLGRGDASDADAGVLERQLRGGDPLGPDELVHVIVVDTEAGNDVERTRDACVPVVAAMAACTRPCTGSSGAA